jgi:hypothetical protein
MLINTHQYLLKYYQKYIKKKRKERELTWWHNQVAIRLTRLGREKIG